MGFILKLRPINGSNHQPPFQIKKNVNLTRIIELISRDFRTVPDHRQPSSCSYQLHDAMMGALSCMFYQEPSWLQYQQHLEDKLHQNNLFTLFNISSIPKESQLRDILDNVDSMHYRSIFKSLFELLRRDKQLQPYRLPFTQQGMYYVAVDGSQYHSSHQIHCEHCLRKSYKSGMVYQHQVLQAALMHPDCRQVIPLMPEAIRNDVGENKQDCEQEAMKRLLVQLKKAHPRLPLLIGGDSLFAHAPTIELIESLNMHYLLSCKPGDHKHLMSWLLAFSDWPWTQWRDNKDRVHRYRWRNDVPLIDSDKTPRVNYVEYEMINDKGKVVYRSGWVTNLAITRSNVERLVRTGRCRWKIENECFNTLKNQGYHMTHNFGHGRKHLANNMYLSILLAFTIHQILELSDEAYQMCRKVYHTKRNLWEHIRVLCQQFIIPDWYWLMAWLLDKDKEYFTLDDLKNS